MKTRVLKIAVMMLVGGLVSCEEKGENNFPEPVEISFEEYSLEGTSCQWNNLNYDESVIVINSNEELENYIECNTDVSYPEIDFSRNTMLQVLVKDVAGCNIDSYVEKLMLTQLPANNYKLSVSIIPSDTANAAPFFRYIAVITEKLGEESTVELNVTVI